MVWEARERIPQTLALLINCLQGGWVACPKHDGVGLEPMDQVATPSSGPGLHDGAHSAQTHGLRRSGQDRNFHGHLALVGRV